MIERIKILTVFIGCFFLRLIPVRAPNLEPIMASLMPLSRKYGMAVAFFFSFLSMVLYDFVTGHVGLWTWTTSITYGIIGVFSAIYFKKFKAKTSNFVIFAVVGTVFFDLVTGVLVAPLLGQSILNAALMQIPFTILHLAGNIGLAIMLSPLLNKWFLSENIFFSKKTIQASSAVGGIKI
jgi:uncharacterized membrane protein